MIISFLFFNNLEKATLNKIEIKINKYYSLLFTL